MAQWPTLPDPSQRRIPDQTRASDLREAEASVIDLTKFLGEHGAGPASGDLALDLLLNEVAAQACLATNATGAAIALEREGKFICRATAGQNTPDLGSHLSTTSGLSAACIQSREVQRCDNPDTDHRVDAAACHRLGVQSVLVVPLMKEKELLGIFEIFSSLPYAFGDREAQTLGAFSRRIVEIVATPIGKEEESAAPPASSAEMWTLVEKAPPPERAADVPEAPIFAAGEAAKAPHHGRDIWTTLLTVAVIGLALLLGWMLGLSHWRKAAAGGRAASVSTTGSESTSANDSPASTHDPTANAPVEVAPVKPSADDGPVKSKTASASGGLTVYEGGKVIFQTKPVPPGARTANQPAVPLAGGPRVRVPSTAADSFVLQRVEPQYPEQARRERVQGPVVMEVEVNKGGAVEGLRTLSGDPRLAGAAADAVRQWRFKPYAPRGQALAFETQITVNFSMP